MSAENAPLKVVVLTTGGTIACTTDEHGVLNATVSGEDLLRPVARRFAPGTIAVEVRELECIDSSTMTFADIDAIVNAVGDALRDPSVSGVVVTHGTDSMEETAVAVDTFHNDSRPVVFTGAQKPFDHPEADGPNNLFEALIVASDASARDIGCLIVFGRAVLPVRGATKWHTTDELAFATNGPEEPTRPDPVPATALAKVNVPIVTAYPGAGREVLDLYREQGVDGIVVEAMGSGNVGSVFSQGLTEVLAAGVPVLISTRVPRGEVASTYSGAAELAQKGALWSSYFRAPQARVLLAISVASGRHLATLV
ncbi:asparaginase [Corynebacterium sp. H127]|uniref:asparaginase n=1 Tax=Corynebacterium sp. H127 TaxID=3133418 RepID=UPI0030B74CAB